MRSKLKYRKHRGKAPKPRVVNVTGKTVHPPLKKGDTHPNFQKGGVYNP